MLFRIYVAKFLIKLGCLLQDLPAKDLIRFSRISYSRPSAISSWTDATYIDSGLFPNEKELFSALPFQRGNLLLLGMGGGKEAIYFAKAGFRVTGIDFIEKMVAKAMENARQRNVEIQGKVQEISRLDFKPACFDVVWYSCSIYSSIPGRKTRIEMLKRVGDWLTQGNIRSEKGDILKDNIEFLHAFSSRIELESEFTDAGFEMVYSHFPQDVINGGALLRKKK